MREVAPILSHLHHLPALIIIGAAIVSGALGGRLFQRLRIPQVVGYIVIGLLLGKSGVRLITQEHLEALRPFSFFALGLIGFNVGGELHRSVFRKYGRQFMAILFSEGLGAFFIVAPLTALVAWLVTGEFSGAVALGLLLGAISSATAPAATVDVLWEYKTRGILTTTVLAIVALDDGLGLMLYAVASSIALRLLGGGGSFLHAVGHTFWEIFGGIGLGFAAGGLVSLGLRKAGEPGRILSSLLGLLILVLGIATLIHVDLILAAMALGATVVNLVPNRSKEAFSVVERFAPPIYVLFFVMVGARLSVHGLPLWVWSLATVYVLGRTAGKMAGAWLGARWTGAAESVRKYLGLCLFSQAGVAIGLALMAGIHLSHVMLGSISMGNLILMTVTTTTFLVQIIGPPCVKIAVQKAGEVGLNVTEEDLIRSYTVRDAMEENVPVFRADTPAREILSAAAMHEANVYPIVDDRGVGVGVITLEEIKPILADPSMADWVVAYDIMHPVSESVAPDMPLSDALAQLRNQRVEVLLVADPAPGGKLVGVLEDRAVQRKISQEVLRRRDRAAAGHEIPKPEPRPA